MKTIPKIDLKDAVTLTPLDMNVIQFDTGDKSNLLADSVPQSSQSAQPVGSSSAPKHRITSLADLK